MKTITLNKVNYAVRFALNTQMDAKVLNGIYWAQKWLTLGKYLLTIIL